MKRFLLAAALLIALVGTSRAQQLEPVSPPSRFEKSLTGTIGGAIKIQMKLSGDAGRLTGTYFYETRKKPLRVEGLVNEHGYFELDEYDASGKVTGYFFGAFVRENGLAGYWSKDMAPTNRLPLRLVENGLPALPQKFSTINARVRNDYGAARLWLIDETIVALEYENVGGNGHTCTLIVDRSDRNVHWKNDAGVLRVEFTKKFFNDNGDGFLVVIRKLPQTLEITLEGNGSYFCGMRAVLPGKVTISKSQGGWIGKAIRK